MQGVFCTSAQFFQVVETDVGVWKRPIPGRVEKIDGTPQKGYYERVLTYETLARKWTLRQIIPRDQLVQQWNDGDPNLMDMDFFLWGSQLDTNAPWTLEEDVDVSLVPPREWRLTPVKNIFCALMKYISQVLTSPDTYRITLKGVKWDVKYATHYAKEHVADHHITQVRHMQSDGVRWRKLPCTSWKEDVDVSGSGTDWTWCTIRKTPCAPHTKGPLRRRYKNVSGPIALIFDTETHLEWTGVFPYEYAVRFTTLF